jgi:hypothetical protein
MTTWKPADLHAISSAREIRIATVRPDGSMRTRLEPFLEPFSISRWETMAPAAVDAPLLPSEMANDRAR